MNWQHITYFCSAARTQNYRKSADDLFVTVSALSKAIASLEEELGVPLFEKSGRNVYLTRYGEAFLEYAKGAIDSIETGKALMQSMAQLEQGKVSIAGIQTMCADFLPLMIRQFAKEHPQVRITLGSAICVDVLEQVADGRVDLGFCSDFEEEDRRFQDVERTLLKKEEFSIVVSNDHRFGAMGEISLKDLEGENMILPKNPQSRNRRAFEEICQEAGISPQIAYELPDDSSIMGMVGAGMGISFMADMTAMHRSDLTTVSIRDLARAQNQYLVWKKSRRMTPAVTMFRDYVLRMV